MRIMRLRVSARTNLSPISHAVARVRVALAGEGAIIGISGLDVSVRSLSVAAALALCLLGYGKAHGTVFIPGLDPFLVIFGLVLYNLLVITVLGVPWRRTPGFFLFLVDWLVATAAVVLTGGLLSPFLILYYALIIGAALRIGIYRSLLLVAACAVVFAALTIMQPITAEAVELPLLAVSITALVMVAITAVSLRRAVEAKERRLELGENTAAQLQLLNNLTRVVLSGSPNLEAVMRTVAAVSSQTLQADSGLAVLFEAPSLSDDGYQDGLHARGRLLIASQDPNPVFLTPNESQVADAVVRAQAPVLVDTTASSERAQIIGRFPALERDGRQVLAVACVPLMLSGSVIGVLFVGRFTNEPFGDTEVGLLTAIGQQMAVAVRLAHLYEMERRRASHSEERERSERDLLSIVSHELRTPLTAIKTCVGTLESLDRSVDSTQDRLLRNISRSTDRLILLVDELLDMAKLRSGHVSLNLQYLNLGDVCLEISAHMKPLFDAKHQLLSLDLPAVGAPRWELLNVLADRRRIEQVVLNLLANANKYTPEQGKITLGATPKDGAARVFVRDTGPGIAPSEQQRVFEKYYQATPRQEPSEQVPDGSGLGLAIARSIVELHGGQIGLRSSVGGGSTFFFVLPQIDRRVASK